DGTAPPLEIKPSPPHEIVHPAEPGGEDTIGRPRNPPWVRRGPEAIAIPQVEDPPRRDQISDHVAVNVEDPFGLSRGAGGIDDIEGVFEVHPFYLAVVGGACHLFLPTHLARP